MRRFHRLISHRSCIKTGVMFLYFIVFLFTPFFPPVGFMHETHICYFCYFSVFGHQNELRNSYKTADPVYMGLFF
jgi:hypothetical protein